MSATFDDALNESNAAQHHYLNGDPGPVRAIFSRRDDVTLCNPVGPLAAAPRWSIEPAEPSSHFSDGSASELNKVSRFVTDELGYVVRIERGQTHIDGSPDPVPYPLRVTMIIRQEGKLEDRSPAR